MSPVETESSKNRVPHSTKAIDIGHLVDHYHKFHDLIGPFVSIFTWISYLLNWKSPPVTGCVWCTSVLLCLLANKYYAFVLCLTLLAILAILGWIIHINQRILSSSTSNQNSATHPSSVIDDAVITESIRYELEIKKKKDLLQNYRQLIKDFQDILLAGCSILEKMYHLFTWKDVVYSTLFYFCSASIIFSATLCSWSTSCAITLSFLFSANTNFVRSIRNCQKSSSCHLPCISKEESVREEAEDSDLPVQPDNDEYHPLQESSTTEDENSDTESNKNIPSDDEAIPTNHTSDSSTSQQDGGLYRKAEVGECYQCCATFNSFTRKRRYCRHCGKDFCPKCCSKKLLRAALGATSPAAQVEKVLVCNVCFEFLTKEDAKS